MTSGPLKSTHSMDGKMRTRTEVYLTLKSKECQHNFIKKEGISGPQNMRWDRKDCLLESLLDFYLEEVERVEDKFYKMYFSNIKLHI